MGFLDEHGLRTPTWALDLDLLRRLEHNGAVERTRAYQVGILERLLNRNRLDRLIEQATFLGSRAYAPSEMLDDLREMVWREVRTDDPIDNAVGRRPGEAPPPGASTALALMPAAAPAAR